MGTYWLRCDGTYRRDHAAGAVACSLRRDSDRWRHVGRNPQSPDPPRYRSEGGRRPAVRTRVDLFYRGARRSCSASCAAPGHRPALERRRMTRAWAAVRDEVSEAPAILDALEGQLRSLHELI